MIDFERVLNNLLIIGILGGFGYLVYNHFRGRKTNMDFIKKFIGGKK